MKMFLGGISTLVTLAFAAVLICGWLIEHGKVPDPPKGLADSGPRDSASTTPTDGQVREPQTKDAKAEGQVSLGKDNGCTISYDSNEVKAFFTIDDKGTKTPTGEVRVWLRAECPPGTKVLYGPWTDGPAPSGGTPTPVRLLNHTFTVREMRIDIDCNAERFSAEYARYSENGMTVYERDVDGKDEAPEPNDGLSLGTDLLGEMISPTSSLATIKETYCPNIISGMSKTARQ